MFVDVVCPPKETTIVEIWPTRPCKDAVTLDVLAGDVLARDVLVVALPLILLVVDTMFMVLLLAEPLSAETLLVSNVISCCNN